jgi:small GTP-binding protein
MGDRSELAEWASNVNWADFVDDDEVYATLAKLKARVEQFEEGDEDEGEARIKLVAVGDGAVGKTSLLIAYAKGTFPDTYVPTVFENYTAPFEHNGQKILLHLWDTAGQEDYDRLRPLSYPGADVVLLCFSLVTDSSFESVKDKWHPEVDHYIKNVPTILVGTKVDLREAKLPDPSTGEFHPVSNDQAEKMADEIGSEKFLAVSAKTGENLKNVFQQAVSIVQANRKLHQKGAGPKKETEKKGEKMAEEEPTLKVVKRQQKDQSKKGKCTLL